MTTTNETWIVGDENGRIGVFTSHDQASEFISTLPDNERGVYYIDGPCDDLLLEIRVHPRSEKWSKVTSYIFRSWSGQRRIDGKAFDGVVFYLGTNEISRR